MLFESLEVDDEASFFVAAALPDQNLGFIIFISSGKRDEHDDNQNKEMNFK